MTSPNDLRAEAERLLARATELETQLSDADVKAMYAEGRYAEIVQAKQDGRLSDLLNPTTATTEEN